MVHLWWTATCKTEGCGELLWLYFIGSFEDVGADSFAIPTREGNCPKCGKIHIYREPDIQIRHGHFPNQPSDASQ
jgi:hypothetical protein